MDFLKPGAAFSLMFLSWTWAICPPLLFFIEVRAVFVPLKRASNSSIQGLKVKNAKIKPPEKLEKLEKQELQE